MKIQQAKEAKEVKRGIQDTGLDLIHVCLISCSIYPPQFSNRERLGLIFLPHHNLEPPG